MVMYLNWFGSIFIFLVFFVVYTYCTSHFFNSFAIGSALLDRDGYECPPHVPLHFLFFVGWWCITSTRCVFTINHVWYLECFKIIVLVGSLCFIIECIRTSFVCLWMITWILNRFGGFFCVCFVLNRSFPHCHSNHHIN